MSGPKWTRVTSRSLTDEHIGWSTGASTLVACGDGWRVWRSYDGELFLATGEGEIDITPPPPPDPWADVALPTKVLWAVQTTDKPGNAAWASDTRSNAEEWTRRNANYNQANGVHARLVRTTGWEVVQ